MTGKWKRILSILLVCCLLLALAPAQALARPVPPVEEVQDVDPRPRLEFRNEGDAREVDPPQPRLEQRDVEEERERERLRGAVPARATAGIPSVQPNAASSAQVNVSVNNPTWGWAHTRTPWAEPGMRVDLGAYANPGLVFVRWEVLAGNVWLASLNCSHSFFIMPTGGDVSIQAVFREMVNPARVHLSENNPAWGEARAWPVLAEPGDWIGLGAYANPGVTFVRWEVLAGDVQLGDPNFPWTGFNMPAGGDVSIRAVFREMVNPAQVIVSVNNPIWGNFHTWTPLAEPGMEVQLDAWPNPDIVFVRWEVLAGDVQLDDPYSQWARFIMPNHDVSVRAVFREMVNPAQVHVSANNPDGGWGGVWPALAEPGMEVTLDAWSNPGFAFVRWEVLSGNVQLEDPYWRWTSFIMPPGGDVSIRAVFREVITSNITVSVNNSTWGEAQAWPEIAEVGDWVELGAWANPGFAFVRWEVLAGDVQLENPYRRWTSFIMPNHDVSVRAVFRELVLFDINVSANNPAWGEVGAWPELAEAGDGIDLGAHANPGFVFDRWEVLAGDVQLDDPYSRWAYFVMPDHDVSIRAVFRAMVNPISITVSANEPDWGWIELSLSLAEPGMEVFFSAEANPGFRFVRWEVLAGGIQLDYPDFRWGSFIAPDQNVSIRAVFRQLGTEGPVLGQLSDLFPDPQLALTVARALGLWNWELQQIIDIPVTQVDLDDIRGLNGWRSGISNLQGIQHLTNLAWLDLGSNQISDLTPLAGFVDLEGLLLDDNQISDLTPLAGLAGLEVLDLGFNQISDLTPLAGLVNLEHLLLDSNQISDIAPLAGLTSLEALGLHANQINNIQPLSTLVNLIELFPGNQQITLSPTLLTNPLTIENAIFGMDGNRVAPESISHGGTYTAPYVTWTGVPGDTAAVEYVFSQDIVLSGGTFRFSGTVTQPLALHDVPAGHWAWGYILDVHGRGIMRGDLEGRFTPHGNLTRAEAATILWNAAGNPAAGAPAPFLDVAGHWGIDAIAWAAEAGVVLGRGDGTFAPNDTIHRQDLFTILWRYARLVEGIDNLTPTPGTGWPFPDHHLLGGWAMDAVMWLHAADIVGGDGYGNLNPLGTANRAEAAAIVVRFMRSFVD